jgi:hypothetical protein
MLHLCHPSRFGFSNNIWYWVQSTELATLQFSPPFWHTIPLRTKYFSQHPLFRQSESVFFPLHDRLFHIHRRRGKIIVLYVYIWYIRQCAMFLVFTTWQHYCLSHLLVDQPCVRACCSSSPFSLIPFIHLSVWQNSCQLMLFNYGPRCLIRTLLNFVRFVGFGIFFFSPWAEPWCSLWSKMQ